MEADVSEPVLCFELEPGEAVGCVQCMREHSMEIYGRGQAALVDMMHSPYGDGQAHYMCNEHLKYHFGSAIERFDPHKEGLPHAE
jgi:hypothetical protein